MLDGSKVQQAREAKGLTRKQLAAELRVSARSLQRWELEGTQPGYAMQLLLAGLLKVPPETLEQDRLAS